MANLYPWSGRYHENGSPVLRVTLGGVDSTLEVEAIVDTGFTGFVCMAESEAAALGLVAVSFGSAVLADGSVIRQKLARGFVKVGADTKLADFSLNPTPAGQSCDVLLGMQFLRQFERCLLALRGGFLLLPNREVELVMAEAHNVIEQYLATMRDLDK